MYIYVYIHTYIYICICIYIHIYIYTYTCIYIHIYSCTIFQIMYIYIIHDCVYMHKHIYIFTNVYIHKYIRIHTCAYKDIFDTHLCTCVYLPKNAALPTSQPSKIAFFVIMLWGSMNPIEHVKKIRDNQCVKLQVLRVHDWRHVSDPPKHMPVACIHVNLHDSMCMFCSASCVCICACICARMSSVGVMYMYLCMTCIP